MKSIEKGKSGFTIIEVVLVLAIAGLIFLMVFIALPALQRSQRDTQRRDDLAMLATAINNYSTNNRGKVPTSDTEWKTFWTNYLKSNAYTAATVATEPSGDSEFVDPLGYNYLFKAYSATEVSSKRTETWDWNSAASSDGSKGYVIHIYSSSHCDGETVSADNSARVVAYKYRLEGAGYYCGDNA